jgi:hypothetical protein
VPCSRIAAATELTTLSAAEFATAAELARPHSALRSASSALARNSARPSHAASSAPRALSPPEPVPPIAVSAPVRPLWITAARAVAVGVVVLGVLVGSSPAV